jgi:hypothetical protein
MTRGNTNLSKNDFEKKIRKSKSKALFKKKLAQFLLTEGYGRARPNKPIEKILSAKGEGNGMPPTPQPLMVPPTPQSLTVLPQDQLPGEAYGKALLNKKNKNLTWAHNIPVENILSAKKEDLIFANNILIEKEIQQKGEGKGGDKGGSKGEGKGGGKGGGKEGPPPPKAKGAGRDTKPPICSELPCFSEIYNQYGLESAMIGANSISKRFDKNDTDVAARVESISTDCDSILTDAANIIRAFSIRINEFNASDEKSWKSALDFITTPFTLVPEAIGKFFEVKNPNELLEKFRKNHGITAFREDIRLTELEIIKHLIAMSKSDPQTVSFDNLPDSGIDWNDTDLDYTMGFVMNTRKTLSVDQIVRAIKKGFEKKVKLCKSNYEKVRTSTRERTPDFRRTSASPNEKKLDYFFELLTDIKQTNLDNVSKQNLLINVSRLGNASAFSVALYAIGSELRKCLSESLIVGDNDFRNVLILLGDALKHVNAKSNIESSDKHNPVDVLSHWANFFELILKEKKETFKNIVGENEGLRMRYKMRYEKALDNFRKIMNSALSVAQGLLEGSKKNFENKIIIDTVYFIRVLIDVYWKSKQSNNHLGICRKF